MMKKKYFKKISTESTYSGKNFAADVELSIKNSEKN